MLWRSDEGKNKPAVNVNEIKTEQTPKPAPSEPASKKGNKDMSAMSREELLEELRTTNPEMYARLKNLRSSVANMNNVKGAADAASKAQAAQQLAREAEARRKKLIADQRKREEAKKKAEIIKKQAEAQKKAEQQRRRAIQKEKEAEAMRRMAERAGIRAGISLSADTPEVIQHEYKTIDQIIAEQAKVRTKAVNEIKSESAHVKEEAKRIANREKIISQGNEAEAARKAALKQFENVKKKQKQAEEAIKKTQKQAEEVIKRTQKQAEEAFRKKAREEALEKQRAQKKAQEKAVKQQREAAAAKIREARKQEAKQRWIEEEERRQQERQKKLEEKLLKREIEESFKAEARRMDEAERKAQKEKKLKKLSEEEATKGGGIVTVHGVEIKTEVNKKKEVKIRDLLGLKTKAERKAATEEERVELLTQRIERRVAARRKYSFNRLLRIRTYEDSKLGRRIKKIGHYCDEHKRGILTSAAAIATVLVSVAAGVNYCTGYEYSYNGAPLGIVDNKNTVLEVTELVSGALSEDNNLDVIITPKDITFKRVSTLGEAKVDTTEDVLKRLTYMGDFKVSSYGVYVDGKKVAAVSNKDDATKVLMQIKNLYVSSYDDSKVVDAVFLENVKINQTTTKLENLMSAETAMDVLTTPVEKETVKTASTGDTAKSIANEYRTTEEEILNSNPDINKTGEISAGTPVVIKTVAPPVTVKITEEVNYQEDIEYEVEKTEDKNMYKGDSVVTQKGEKGERDIHSTIVLVNGSEIDEQIIDEKITKEPVTKKITVGTKKRPPTVGDGKFSSPLKDPYRLTSGFKMRWGRLHKGLDMACPTGTPVYAADGGTVVIASYKPSYGNLVVIDHQNGYTTKYAHNSKIVVKVGDKVYEGQKIAEVGSTGNSTGPHSHFEIRYNDVPKNPAKYINVR